VWQVRLRTAISVYNTAAIAAVDARTSAAVEYSKNRERRRSDHCKGPSGEVASVNRIADCQLNRDILNLQTTGLDETRI